MNYQGVMVPSGPGHTWINVTPSSFLTSVEVHQHNIGVLTSFAFQHPIQRLQEDWVLSVRSTPHLKSSVEVFYQRKTHF